MGGTIARKSLHSASCTHVALIGAKLLLCGIATGNDETHWRSCVQESISDAPAMRDCNWRLRESCLSKEVAGRAGVGERRGLAEIRGSSVKK